MKDLVKKLEMIEEDDVYDDMIKIEKDNILTDLDGIEDNIKDILSKVASLYTYCMKRKRRNAAKLIDDTLLTPLSNLVDSDEQTSIYVLKRNIEETIE